MTIQLAEALGPQTFKIAGMTTSVYNALMSAVDCTDPSTCPKKLVVWREDPSVVGGWAIGDTTMPEELWSPNMTKTPGDDAIYIIYNHTLQLVTISGMTSVASDESSSSGIMILGLGLLAAVVLFKSK